MKIDLQRTTAKLLIGLTLLTGLGGFSDKVFADLRVPAWYDQNAVNTAPDWHYRVPINVPAGAAINSTIKVDVNFVTLLTTLGVAGTFDANSPRVVRSTGALAGNQEFTDGIFGGATDAIGDGKGEVRFILDDAGAVTYYLYFDVTANGVKPLNPQTPINGNFEQPAVGAAYPPVTGIAAPVGWLAPTIGFTGVDAQLRPNDGLVSVTTSPTPLPAGAPNPRNTDGSPNTGQFSYLIGARSILATSGGSGTTTFTKAFTVPTGAGAGNISVRYRPEGWDSSSFDSLTIQVVGTTTVTVLGSPANVTAYALLPNSPAFGGGQVTTTTPGYNSYNSYDCGTNNVHTAVPPMSVACGTDNWFTATASLAALAGQAVTLRFSVTADVIYKSWFSFDNVEWSVVAATLGTPEAFGVNITNPAVAAAFTAGQTLSITAQVDAQPNFAGTPVTADVYDNAGTLVASGIILYNNGTNGDATAGDAIWTNTTALVIPAGFVPGANWLIRVYARDIGGNLIKISGQPAAPTSQANYWNIDEIKITVNLAALSVQKTATLICDPFNGVTNPKNIPGSITRYTITIANAGTASASLATVADALINFLTLDPNLVQGATAATCTSTVPPGVVQVGGAVGKGFNINVTGSTRTGYPKFLTNVADADGATFASPNITIDYSTALPAGVFGINTYAAGELKPGETVTVYFNVTVN